MSALKSLCAWLWTGCLVFLSGWQMAHAPNEVSILKGFGYIGLATVTLWEVKKRFKS